MDLSISLSDRKEAVVAELRGVTPRDQSTGQSKQTPVTEASHGDARGLLAALASYIEVNAEPDTNVTVSLNTSVTLTQIDYEG